MAGSQLKSGRSGPRPKGAGGLDGSNDDIWRGWSLTRVLYLAVMLYLALHLSYILEYITSAVLDFGRSPEEPEDRGDLIRYSSDSVDVYSYPTLATYSPAASSEWDPEEIVETVPVVFYWAKPGDGPCIPGHYVVKIVTQACKLNSPVYFIGPQECASFYSKLGVTYQSYKEYEDVYEWFMRNIGSPVDNHVRWYILKRFLEKTEYSRVFYVATEVMLYANVTELAAWMFPQSHIVLPARWPSLRPPLRVNQYVSTAVAGHTALFSYEGLADWCLFLLEVFRIGLFGGQAGSPDLPTLPPYNDMIPMGWYTFAECWLQDFNPSCMAEKGTGITGQLAMQMRGRYRPKFRVESFCQPRVCQNSTWSDYGRCVFDNNFSITTATMYFKFSRKDKCPTSANYAYYEAWAREPQKGPVQFLAVHFQGKKKEFLTLDDDDPANSWGGSSE